MLKYNYYSNLVKFNSASRGVNPHRIANLLGAIYNCLELLQTDLNKKDKMKITGTLNKAIKEVGVLTGVWIEDNERIELE
jgi:hypothetical protein